MKNLFKVFVISLCLILSFETKNIFSMKCDQVKQKEIIQNLLNPIFKHFRETCLNYHEGRIFFDFNLQDIDPEFLTDNFFKETYNMLKVFLLRQVIVDLQSCMIVATGAAEIKHLIIDISQRSLFFK